MNSVPLADALPWERTCPPCHGATILVTDSIETDGRFLLHTLASQYISATNVGRRSDFEGHKSLFSSEKNNGVDTIFKMLNQRVIWISCDSLLEKQVVGALKKIGCDASKLPSIASISSSNCQSRAKQGGIWNWHFVSMNEKMADFFLNGGGSENIAESCAKSICKDIIHLMTERFDSGECNTYATCPLVVLDNVSSLAETLGEAFSYALIQQIRSALISQETGCLLMRCSNELQDDVGSMSTMLSKERSTAWMGFGGQEETPMSSGTSIFENGLLMEIADCIIDVIPLQSGFSNEAHGRIIVTERLGGRGWTHPALLSPKDTRRSQLKGRLTSRESAKSLKRRTFNFVCSDNQVKAIHLRAKS